MGQQVLEVNDNEGNNIGNIEGICKKHMPFLLYIFNNPAILEKFISKLS